MPDNKKNRRVPSLSSETGSLESKIEVLRQITPAGIFETDSKGACIYVNDEWCRLTGMDSKDAMGYGWTNAIHPQDRPHVTTKWNNSVTENKPFFMEFRYLSPDGIERWVSVRCTSIKNSKSETIGFLGVSFDIGHLKNSEHELRSLNQAFENAIEGISRIDLEGRYKFVNPSFARLCGYNANEMVGLHWLQTIHNDDLMSAQSAYQEMLNFGKCTAEMLGRRKDGTTFPIEVVLVSEYSQDNKVTGYHCFMKDITQRRQAKLALTEAKEIAESGNKAKSEFLATMSHEIRTPLNGIVGCLSLLRDTNVTPEQQSYLDTAIQSSDILLSVIEDILDFSKIEAGKIRVETIDFDLHKTIGSVQQAFAFQAQSKGLSLRFNECYDLEFYLRGDPSRFRQILTNLISNAIKFTDHGSVEISIHLKNEDTQNPSIYVEVIDTGIGIPPEALHKIFQAFTQVDSGIKRRFGGTGLGLSICKRLVDLMNGEIGVRTMPTKGSCFWFSLPCSKTDIPIREYLDYSLSTRTTNSSLRILVAEDVRINQQVMKGLLESLGHRIDTVASGNEVLDALRSSKYDLIFMDCHMPEMDGYETTRIIRNSNSLSNRDIPIVALTANVLKGEREKCLAAGMSDYLSKPVDKKALDSMIQKWSAFSPDLFGSQIVNTSQVQQLVEVQNGKLFDQLMKLLITKTPLELKTLREKMDNKDTLGIKYQTHALKSAFGNIGLTQLEKAFAYCEYNHEKIQNLEPKAFMRVIDTLFSQGMEAIFKIVGKSQESVPHITDEESNSTQI